MKPYAERCPFLVPVTADQLFVFPVSAYCRRPDERVRVPGAETFSRICATPSHVECLGYQASVARMETAAG